MDSRDPSDDGARRPGGHTRPGSDDPGARRRDESASRPHVVIVGAGFAGLNVARQLMRHLDDTPARVTVIDRNNYHTFQPLLYQVATAGLQAQDIGHSVRGVLSSGARSARGRPGDGGSPIDVRWPRFRLGTVVDVDWEAHRLRLADGTRVDFDVLVLAAGATTADYGIPGVAAHAFKLKSIPQALSLRNHVLTQFERAATEPDALDDGALTFVIAGGGPTGVELAGALHELATVLLRDHPELQPDQVHIVLAEMLDTVLPPYSRRMQRYTRRALEERGIELRLGTAIREVRHDRVYFDDGDELPTRTLVWTAGVRANPLAEVLGVEQAKGGRLPVDAALRLRGHPEAFVVGDLAGPLGQRDALPQLAPVAIQQGRHVGDQIPAVLHGRAPAPFRYRNRGKMATIGRHDAVVELPGRIRFGGSLAWAAWLLLHLLYLVGFRNRLSVLLTWAWNYVTYERAARLIVNPEQREPEDVVEDPAAQRATPDGPA